jgi:hypothetical protein
VVFFEELFQQGIFALGGVDLQAVLFFDDADLVHEIGPFREQVHQAGVHLVDFFSNIFQTHGGARFILAPRWLRQWLRARAARWFRSFR